MNTPVTPIIELKDIEVEFKTRAGSIFRPKKVKAVDHVSLKLMLMAAQSASLANPAAASPQPRM